MRYLWTKRSEEVLLEVGSYSWDEIAQLKEEGVIDSWPEARLKYKDGRENLVTGGNDSLAVFT